VPVDALMRISFRTEWDATRGITPEQNIRGFRPNECCDVGLSELEAMSVLGGPRLRAGDGEPGSYQLAGRVSTERICDRKRIPSCEIVSNPEVTV